MKSRSTHNRKQEEEDNSGDSNTVTTKPTSRALLALLPFNKPGNVEGTTKTTGCGRGNNDSGGVADSTSRNRRSGRDKNAASGVNVGVGRVGDGAVGDDRRDFRSDRRKFVLRGKQKGGGSGLNSISQRSGKDTNTGRGGVSKLASRSKQRGLDGTDTNTSRGGVLNLATRSTRSGRETTTTTTRRHHGSNVEWSPSSSSSSSSSSKSSKGLYYLFTSSNGDDDDDDDYVDKRGKKRQSGTKKDGRMKKKGGKTEAVESPEVLKAAEFPLTLRDSKKKQKNDDRKKAAEVIELLSDNETVSGSENNTVENYDNSICASLRPKIKLKSTALDHFFKVLGNDDNRKKDGMFFFSPDFFSIVMYNISPATPDGELDIKRGEEFCNRLFGDKGKSFFTGHYNFFFPMHIPPKSRNGHWVLGVIDTKNKRIDIYNSCANSRSSRRDISPLAKYQCYANAFFRFFNILQGKNKYPPMVEHNWKISHTPVSSAPLQKNDKDCGVIVCYCASALSTEKKSLEFSHNDIIEWNGRQKIAQSIQKESISESLFKSNPVRLMNNLQGEGKGDSVECRGEERR